jgi:propanol-preferring alcohol dehydrogenase
MDEPPCRLDSAIVFAPAGKLVPLALEALERGGTLALAGIHMSPVPPLDYGRHLFLEKNVRSVMSNTRADGEALLRLAGRLRLKVHTTRYDFEDVGRALEELGEGRVTGSLVVRM